MGPTGTGKTYSIATLLQSGLEVFVIITEPNGLDTLLDAVEKKNLDLEKLHWRYVAPAPMDWKALSSMAKTINELSYEDIASLKSGIDKKSNQQFIELLKTLADFKDERTGESFGDVTTWGDDRALVIDSLSGINMMAMNLTIGQKPAAHQGEWGVMMRLIEELINQVVSKVNCFFVLTAHVDREPNEVSGGTQITVGTLGRKLAPKLPRFFSEVVKTRRGKTGEEFKWSTFEQGADLKNRALPIGDSLEPSFQPLVTAHRRRKASAAK